MLRLFFFRRIKKSKSGLPNPNFEYRLVFKKGAIETIKITKGWKTDADMARALGLTRQYVSMLHRTRTTVTSTVITRLAAQLGNTESNWWIYFEIVAWGIKDTNHPNWNQEKYMGRMPYSRYSSSAELRQRDYATESLNER
ncbi:MAG: hypothetical protein PHH69_02760 [Candidatus Omnitrophica bacterium]|nr:hypothetical protein [Candidatus Omnitrophota bacterium]